ncbi:MAG TPA: LysR family transcriptional regulator [Burkholderiaceae bacterium]|jgi:DNA-binding transcriptional LysR family regulator|uniref:LysR family transcriptional regulator n=1 Tax=Candidatus Skiveiella danica TaxID=3386177 RepID=UPI001DBC25D6|nr:LysR family transcriptional regulator [Comamonadaceae bacterium]MBK9199934.1 LysR family transcriptional regulator [Betaproteobacteria bacterium]HOF29396.1 LysR family transcriptional regulator [Burkholderiaceae bacterium]MBK6558144.1 LysR family transcriptional regulator [Comamonadaceae bacterium]MBK6927174.1 LysR family transcriptional regulator [Comamonadaceae bacterium]
MDALRQIEAFVAVVRAGSYVKAAERQETSKAVLSRQVLELETRLGTRLLNRTTRRLSLTETGAAYFERCVQILDDLREADAAAGATTATARGRLRINAPLTFGNLHLAPLWGEFLKLHPAVELDITLTDRVVDLVEEGFDLAVRIAPTGRLPSSSLVARTIADDRIVLCASPGYLRGAPALTHPADLAAHAVMAYAWWSGGDTWQFSGADGATADVTVRPRLRTNSGDTCRAAALADQGVIYQPAFLVGPDLRAGRLVELLSDWRGPTLDIHAVYPSRTHLSGKVRAMVDFLAQAFVQPGWR